MKKINIIGLISFLLALVSLPLSFWIITIIGEVNIFYEGGLLRYSWIMLMFIPLGIFAIVLGYRLKKAGEKYKKNYVVGFIVTPLLLIFGFYRFIFADAVSYDNKELMQQLNEYIGVEMSEDFKSTTLEFGGSQDYIESRLKLSKKDKELVDEKIKENPNWVEKLAPAVKGMLPLTIQSELNEFEYYFFWDTTNDAYNCIPANGYIEYVFAAYDVDCGSFVIIDSCEVEIMQ